MDSGTLTQSMVSRALDELWAGEPFPPPPGYFLRCPPRPPDPEWTVSAGGYRLIIEHGAIVGLGYGEDPWPWGDPAWLVSHLNADAERRAWMVEYTMNEPHRCDDECVCPRHGTPMIYAPARDDHACQDVNCPYGHGLRALLGAGR